MYCTDKEFVKYLGDDPNNLSDRDDLASLLLDCETRLRAYIVPNSPRCDEQIEAFKTAVYEQLIFELAGANAQLMGMPAGIMQFTVNGFSATIGSRTGGTLSNAGLSPRARAELLYAGLLSRGVCVC